MRKALLTLWDLLRGETAAPVAAPARRVRVRRVIKAKPKPDLKAMKAPAVAAPLGDAAPLAPESMEEKYDRMVRELLGQYGVRVRKWRKGMSGVAWCVMYRDGRVQRLIEAPRPTGPMSAAVFCHEIGHHAIGFDVYKPRCLEEYHAWAWALAEMERRGLNITDRVRTRMQRSLEYAVAKAVRRGIKSLPPEMVAYLPERYRGKV